MSGISCCCVVISPLEKSYRKQKQQAMPYCHVVKKKLVILPSSHSILPSLSPPLCSTLRISISSRRSSAHLPRDHLSREIDRASRAIDRLYPNTIDVCVRDATVLITLFLIVQNLILSTPQHFRDENSVYRDWRYFWFRDMYLLDRRKDNVDQIGRPRDDRGRRLTIVLWTSSFSLAFPSLYQSQSKLPEEHTFTLPIDS